MANLVRRGGCAWSRCPCPIIALTISHLGLHQVNGAVTSGPSLAVEVNGLKLPNPFVIGAAAWWGACCCLCCAPPLPHRCIRGVTAAGAGALLQPPAPRGLITR